jgi:flagellar hook-associated protein 3 FlgL
MSSLGSILPGRVPLSLMASQMVDNINTLESSLDTLDEQISSGQQLTLPSDNPTATSIVLQLQDELATNTQDTTNVSTDQSLMSATDSALQSVSSALSQANSLLLSGNNSTNTTTEFQSLANQVQSIIQGLLNTANSTYQGQYLFGGSETNSPPFQQLSDGTILYTGDNASINSYIDGNLTVANNVTGIAAFGAISTPVGSDVDPAVTLQTNLSDLNGGSGVQLGEIQVTVNTGTPQTETVNLAGAQTVADVQQDIQNAFPPGTLTVGIVSGVPQDALQITPSSGTVSISDVNGDQTAQDLGIASGPVASITGSNLNPLLTLQTPLSAFNGGAGASTSNGITITTGSTSQVVDISGDTTVQQLLNTLQTADPNLDVGINSAGNGLAISTRLSGVNFSIGENGGDDAASLGINTFTGSTLLSSLNLGQGVPVNETDASGNVEPADLDITQRDGTSLQVNLAGATTVQDVLNDINAADPGVLTATLNTQGNGITINDTSGTGTLTVASNNVSTALGIAGTAANGQALVGQDVNPIQANGVFNTLLQLSSALESGNTTELTQLQPQLQQEIDTVSGVTAKLGSQQQLVGQIQTELASDNTDLQGSISNQMSTNMAQALTQLEQLSTSLQATLQVTASTMQMSLFNYLQ